ncbi:Acylphosphatase family protein [Coccidioides posadasii C735 delta SOWgp]|uniref:Acylphosphatase n=2 Tax=Coccidioides posadasii TaxID=199306 RepID=A0A0J6F843_COCPO|nr:Acylphosphatase family protein [Coccidioides posadasii C735 delta SOWgp]EER23941.1 Acylphosphatase family protein [Coccidioides posadasii C735 delta SOWgp]KMM65465.1 hypothetical protein CPAG_01814 [Coccidioides posadasii RMSCC 3488]|eukprot:XP_003066086.1 Acylphosphatase family protein [Coccidioides posadasii C735 delta SOWgp]
MAKRVAFMVQGRVQGVFFRDFTQRNANLYGLTGWVRNTTDGKVQGEAQGDEESITKLIEDISRGPRHAQVTKLEKSEIDPKVGESRFQVVR